MSKSIQEITETITKFRDDRGWENANPTVLITALLGELGELADHYNWEISFERFDDEKKREVGYEFVDVLFYLFTLAKKSDIDIEKYFDEKLPKIAQKFPLDKSIEEHLKNHEEYRKTGKNRLYE